MNATATKNAVAEVRDEQGEQTLHIPRDFRFAKDHVYLRRDVATGLVTISEHPFPEPARRLSIEEVFAQFDALDLSDFEIKRDHSPSRNIDF